MENWDMAAAAFDQLLERFPGGAYADSSDMGRARIDIRQNNLDSAISRLKRLQGSPDSKLAAQSVLLLGRAYEKAGRPDEAIRAYLFLATLFDHPQWVPEAYRKAVELLLAQGRAEDARKHFENLNTNYPDSPEVETVRKMLQPQAEQNRAKNQD
jgi:TolA-binding protein